MKQESFEIFQKALTKITLGRQMYNGDLLQRDGLLQRYEYTVTENL